MACKMTFYKDDFEISQQPRTRGSFIPSNYIIYKENFGT